VSKVVLAAREVAELDPTSRRRVRARASRTERSPVRGGADVIVDECDGLEMKLALREHARAARRPVVMATSHRGMLDVERFDREPGREPFHGLLGGVGSSELRGLTTKQKVPYVLRILGAASLSDRMAASLVEVTRERDDVAAAGVRRGARRAMVANAVRRIALGELSASGRFFADLDELTADRCVVTPTAPPEPMAAPTQEAPAMPGPRAVGPEAVRFVVACASSAPSGGNMQPWRFEAEGDVIRDGWTRSARRCWTSRAGVAAGAGCGARGRMRGRPRARTARGGARIGGRRAGVGACARRRGPARRARGRDPVAALLQPAHRRLAAAPGGRAARARGVRRAARRRRRAARGAARLGAALGALDRVRFLSERLRRELIGELRFDGAEAATTRDGIDVASLELDAADRAAMDVLRTGAGMDLLARLGRGQGLGNASRDAFAGAGGAVVLRTPGVDRAALIEAGRGLMRLWLEATRRGLAVHPWGRRFSSSASTRIRRRWRSSSAARWLVRRTRSSWTPSARSC
jgi:hypothetical protein